MSCRLMVTGFVAGYMLYKQVILHFHETFSNSSVSSSVAGLCHQLTNALVERKQVRHLDSLFFCFYKTPYGSVVLFRHSFTQLFKKNVFFLNARQTVGFHP